MWKEWWGALLSTPIESDEFLQQHAVKDKGAEDLARFPARMLEKQASM